MDDIGCLSFSYYLASAKYMYTLKVYLQYVNESESNYIWNGNAERNLWQRATVELPDESDYYRVCFKAEDTAGYHYSVSVDDVNISQGTCKQIGNKRHLSISKIIS